MLVRDINGRMHIISRKDCKSDTDYYQKIYKIRLEYTKQYKSVVRNDFVRNDFVRNDFVRNDLSKE